MMYNQTIKKYYNDQSNFGSLDENDPNVYVGESGEVSCGDLMMLYIKVNPETTIIEDAKIKTFGCMTAFASSSYLSQIIIGKTIEQASKITNKEIKEYLDLPSIKIHCSVLAEEAIKNVISLYMNRNNITSFDENNKKETKNKLTENYEIKPEKNTQAKNKKETQQIINFTENAIQQIKKIINDSEKEIIGIRVSVENNIKNCMQMKYKIEYAEKIITSDIVIKIQNPDKNEINFLIEGNSLIFLIGTTVDFETSGLNSSFTFKNPNAKMQCGCGKTFSHINYFELLGIEESKEDIDIDKLNQAYISKKQILTDSAIIDVAYKTLYYKEERDKYLEQIKKIKTHTN